MATLDISQIMGKQFGKHMEKPHSVLSNVSSDSMNVNTQQGILWRIGRNLPWFGLAVLVLAVFTRLFALGKDSLWLDEAYQVVASSNSWRSILQTCIHMDTHPPLYYLLQHFWMLVFGQSEAAVRSLSACLGIVSVLLVYLVGRELFDRRTGLIASFLLTISLMSISISQEGRPYSLLMLGTLLSFFFFIRILRANGSSKRLAFLYILANLILCYTHIYGLFALASQWFYFLCLGKDMRKRKLYYGPRGLLHFLASHHGSTLLALVFSAKAYMASIGYQNHR